MYKFKKRKKDNSFQTTHGEELSGESEGEEEAPEGSTLQRAANIAFDSVDDEVVEGSSINDVTVNVDEMADEVAKEEAELSCMKLGRHVQAARAQRLLFNMKVKEARVSDTSDDHRRCKTRCLVVDYAQNMELPWFGESQPGEVRL